MPFKSKSQERFLYANAPEVARKFEKESVTTYHALPEKIGKDKKRMNAIERNIKTKEYE